MNLTGVRAAGKSKELPTQTVLSPEQEEALRITRGPDPLVFITGRAGTGKSTIIQRLRLLPNFAVCAPTGIAALNCRGATLHSTFKIPPRFHDPAYPNPKTIPGLDKLRGLVIDEISMVRADVLDYVSATLQYNRASSAPFGGVKVIVVGDCRQLPPVVTDETKEAMDARYKSGWWFDALCLKSLTLRVVQLTQIHRQTDNDLIDILDRIRHGAVNQATVIQLNERCYHGSAAKDNVLILTATRNTAENLNRMKLDAIDSPSQTYEAVATGSFIEEDDQNYPAPKRLELKVGARALITKNHASVVNGTLGTVTRLRETSVHFRPDGATEDIMLSQMSWDKYRYELRGGQFVPEVTGTYRQIPLTYGWAITIHKAQGLTLDAACIDLGNGAFASGQTYVALSRTRDFGGLSVRRPLNQRDFIADPRVTEFHRDHDVH